MKQSADFVMKSLNALPTAVESISARLSVSLGVLREFDDALRKL